jgi:two-component system sensor histidine kinase KdpD
MSAIRHQPARHDAGIEAGTLEIKRDWVAVSPMSCNPGGERRAERWRGPDRRVETRHRGGTAARPWRQRDYSSQVVFNLLDNAVKYGGDEPVNVYARRDGADVLISVTDLGKGIPPAEIDRVFEKFYRRGKPDGRSPGTGLGLSIARGFVEAMGGKIHAESPAVKKRGTRIVIRFPAADKTRAEKTP